MIGKEKFIKCPFCQAFVSENTWHCPHCKHSLKKKPPVGSLVFSCIILFLAFFVLTFALLEVDYSNSSITRDTTISMAEFNKIQTGMTYSEVVNIIGVGGELMSQVDIGYAEYATQMYSWDGNGGTGSNATVMFQGGKVVSKAQFGLK